MTMENQTDRSPREELANRAATAGGGIAAAKAAIGIQDHKQMLDAHAKRVKEGHRAMMSAAGYKPSDLGSSNEVDGEMGGDIMITGDIRVEQQKPEEKQPAKPLGKLALAGALVLAASGGVALPIVASAVLQALAEPEKPTVKPVDKDTRYELRLSTGAPGETD